MAVVTHEVGVNLAAHYRSRKVIFLCNRVLSQTKKSYNRLSHAGLILLIYTALRSFSQLVRAHCVTVVSALALVCALAPLAFSSPGDPLRFRPGLRNSGGIRELNVRQHLLRGGA